jgi:hypothetical protein
MKKKTQKIPASFKRAMADVKNGRVYPMDLVFTSTFKDFKIKKMKTVLSSILLAFSLAAKAQTDTNNPFTSGPLVTGLTWLGSASNIMGIAYGTMNDKADKFGGGVALAYKVSDFLAPTLRLDYWDGKVWMPSASLQLQSPITIGGKLTVIPFALSGIATPIAGKGTDNGTAVGIFGAGLAVRVSAKFDLIADCEKWTSFDGLQYRFGALYKF